MSEKNYKIDEFILDISKRELIYKDNPVHLSSRAFDILHYLLQKKGTVVTKDELLDKVWADSFVEESNLAVHISAIRRVLKERKGETRFIKTVSGRGYSFVSNVEEFGVKQNRVEKPKITKDEDIAFEEERKKSLAVLPIIFEEKGNENEYLANGITHSLISDLSQIPDLRVLSYSAVKGYKNSDLQLQEIGFLLDAEKLFTGHIYKYDNKLAIGFELINANDKSCLWGNEYVFESDDIFKVKKEISKVIAEKLKLKLHKQVVKKEISSEAQKLYYRGKFVLESRTTKKEPKEYLKSALDYFRKAVEINPKYALAHIGIGTANVSLHNLNLKGVETHEAAKRALKTALEIDNTLSEVYVLKGSIEIMFDDNVEESKKSFDRAIELNSNNPDAYHWKGLACMFLGEYDEALELETVASELDPTSIRFNEGLMRIFFYAEDYEKSIVQAEDLLEFDRKNPSAYLFLAMNYAHLGSFDLANEYIDKGYELRKLVEYSLIKAYIYALAGERKEALKIVDEVLEATTPDCLDSRDIAIVYCALNETEKSIEYLVKAKQEKRNLHYIKNDVRFKNVNNQQAVIELIQK